MICRQGWQCLRGLSEPLDKEHWWYARFQDNVSLKVVTLLNICSLFKTQSIPKTCDRKEPLDFRC